MLVEARFVCPGPSRATRLARSPLEGVLLRSLAVGALFALAHRRTVPDDVAGRAGMTLRGGPQSNASGRRVKWRTAPNLRGTRPIYPAPHL